MLEVSLLGPVEVVVDGRRHSIGSAAQRALLAALALRPGEVVSGDRLVDLIWGEDPPDSAGSGLHVFVSRLRKVVGIEHLVTRPPGYLLADTSTDLETFEALARSPQTPAAEALALWRGEPFGELADREPFRAEAIRLSQLRQALEERRVEEAISADPAWAVAEAEALCQAEPLRETRWELLARALAESGRTPEAVRALSRARETLAEVGLEPSGTLTDLEDRLLAGAVPSPAAAPPAPERRGVAPPLLASPLVGRDQEMSELAELVRTHRLVTLIGPGGVGKTNLARAVTRADGMPAEARWCELADHDDPAAVAPAVARAVGAPVTGRIEETLVESLRRREMVLVLDNCEHLISEAARMAELIIGACPQVVILATSRGPLGVPAEWVFRVRPLDPQRAAVELFMERARSAGAPSESLDPGTVERICRLVDGLPLAVEMAAARVPALGVTELAERLDDSLAVLSPGPRTGGERHRTLEKVVEWSVDLLDEKERLVLERSAVFAGRFRLAAAEDVAGHPPLTSGEVAPLLSSLVDRSLLSVEHSDDGVAYLMLDTVRRVVRGWLGDEPEMAARHAHYYSSLAEEVGAGLVGREEGEARRRLLGELSELRAAVFRSLDSRPEVAARTCAALYPIVYHCLRADIAAWAVRVFPAVEELDHPAVPTVGAMAALASVQTGDIAEAVEICERARKTGRRPQDLLRVAEVSADVATYRGRLDEVLRFADEMVTVARARGEPANEALALVNLTIGLIYTGRRDEATRCLEDARRLNEEVGSETVDSWIDYAEGEMLLDHDPARAGLLLDRAVTTARRTANRFVEGAAGLSAATLRARHGDPEDARAVFAANISHWLEVGDWIHQWVTLRNLALLLERLGDGEGAALVLEAVEERERPSYGEEAQRLDELGKRLRADLGDGGYEELARRARRLEDREVVELALQRLDGSNP
ncbi:MAG: BTAD domain-containing putative transcriptional regulator [Actinomycetota bacterium]